MEDIKAAYGDYRLHRVPALYQYLIGQVVTWDIDPAYPILDFINKELKLDDEGKYWLAWLYGAIYNENAAYYVFKRFPDFNNLDMNAFESWHRENWRKLKYGTDLRYKKGHLVEMTRDYKERLRGLSQKEYFERLLKETPEQSFTSVFNDILKLKRYGRYSAFFYSETLARDCGLNITPPSAFLDWDSCKSSRRGLLYALDREDLIKTSNEIDKASLQQGDEIFNQFKATSPVALDYWFWETTLCAYKGLWKENRYLGYYIDRQLESTWYYEDKVKENQDIFWRARKNIFWEEMRGEEHFGSGGIREALKTKFKEYGHLCYNDLVREKGFFE